MTQAVPRAHGAPIHPSARLTAARVHDEREPAPAAPRYQGLVTRGIAFAIDAALINAAALVVTGAIALLLSVLSVPASLGPALVAVGGVAWLAWSAGYFVVFWSAAGQTPGSHLMRIQVQGADGSAVRPGRALLRLVGLTLAAIPLLAGFVPVLFDSRRRGVHDMLARTVVVDAPDVTRPEDAG